MKKLLKSALKLKLKLAGVAVVALAVLGIAIEAPQLHSSFIRSYVGSKVVLLKNAAGTSGGTGFAVTAPSGKVYTLTNRHVCKLGPNVLHTVVNGKKTRLRVLKVSSTSDLCLLEGVKGASGLDLASSVSIGEEMGIVGHPKLMPLTLSRGQLIGYDIALVMFDFGPCPPKSPKMMQTVQTYSGVMCVLQVKAGFTNAVALPGNSGSPVVNVFGNLVGVLFAADNEVFWGLIVPLSEVRSFLKNM